MDKKLKIQIYKDVFEYLYMKGEYDLGHLQSTMMKKYQGKLSPKDWLFFVPSLFKACIKKAEMTGDEPLQILLDEITNLSDNPIAVDEWFRKLENKFKEEQPVKSSWFGGDGFFNQEE